MNRLSARHLTAAPTPARAGSAGRYPFKIGWSIAKMIFAFVDETSDRKRKDYFGLCCVVINATNYVPVKREFQKILLDSGWNPKYEFKGSFIFSTSKGDPDISVEQRVKIAQDILELNTATKNTRPCFHYFHTDSKDHKREYLTYFAPLLQKALPKVDHKNGKDILCLQCDRRDDISPEEIYQAIEPVLKATGYTLFEGVQMVVSGFNTVGLLYADIVAYLKSRHETIGNDSELFDNVPPEEWKNNGKIRKFLSSNILLEQIKKLKVYEVKKTQKG